MLASLYQELGEKERKGPVPAREQWGIRTKAYSSSDGLSASLGAVVIRLWLSTP